jgi:xylulose-5-phosphate/fructose-6-phosphate phosphoketolase
MDAYWRAANDLSVGQIYLDRFHLAQDVIDRVPPLRSRAAHLRQRMAGKLVEHHEYIRVHGDDLPEVRDWRWKP